MMITEATFDFFSPLFFLQAFESFMTSSFQITECATSETLNLKLKLLG